MVSQQATIHSAIEVFNVDVKADLDSSQESAINEEKFIADEHISIQNGLMVYQHNEIFSIQNQNDNIYRTSPNQTAMARHMWKAVTGYYPGLDSKLLDRKIIGITKDAVNNLCASPYLFYGSFDAVNLPQGYFLVENKKNYDLQNRPDLRVL